MNITPQTKMVALIGHPVGHSFSPQLHNRLYKELDLDMVYMAFDVLPELVSKAVNGMNAMQFAGFNVTIPHKENVFKLLSCVDEEAASIGSVNTVRIENGQMFGYNTDGQGFLQSLLQRNITIKGKKIAILGAGGSARSIGIYLAKELPDRIDIINRTYDRAERLADIINVYKQYKLAWASRDIPVNADIIINTTSLGMWPHTNENPLEGYPLQPVTVVCDIVYNPRLTSMLQYAKHRGCTTIGGIDMLIGQGLRAVEIWTGAILPNKAWDIMYKASDIE